MLVYDASSKLENPNSAKAMEAYLKGVFDAAEFKEEDHPRGGKGSEAGGRFVKSEKTKRKEDEDVDDLGSGGISEDDMEAACDAAEGFKGTSDKFDGVEIDPHGEGNKATLLLSYKGLNWFSGAKGGISGPAEPAGWGELSENDGGGFARDDIEALQEYMKNKGFGLSFDDKAFAQGIREANEDNGGYENSKHEATVRVPCRITKH